MSRCHPAEIVQLIGADGERGPLLRLTCEGDGDLHHYPERCKRPNCADPNCREWGNVQILTGEHAGHWMHHVSECEMVTPDAEALKALTEGLFMASVIRRHRLTVFPLQDGWWSVYTNPVLGEGQPDVHRAGPDLAALVAEVAHECEAALEAARGDKEAHDDAEDHGAGCGC